MNKLYTFLLIITCVCFQLTTNAQTKNGSIKGTVKTSDGKPAAFVSVGLTHTNKGTTTDDNGNFIITNIKPGY
jgi:iron complex outermembrane receptor protein